MEYSSNNTSIKIVLPIYYTKIYKTKPEKVILMSINWYRNAFYHDKNDVKVFFKDLIKEQLENKKPIKGKYKLHLDLYYKRASCDGSNIIALMEKFSLDAFQELGIVKNDSVLYHVGSSWSVIAKDYIDPRCVITITEE